MKQLQIYFSDFFNIDTEIIESYGAVNISLINDFPLFVDPFLLFSSNNQEYQNIHKEIISYLLFLKGKAEINSSLEKGMYKAWYHFAEIKENWLGFSKSGNNGRGLGFNFAQNLHEGLRTIFKDFGNETITKDSHIEKLCLISSKVGRDKISDLTTNFTKKFLLEYTERFALKYLKSHQCKRFPISRVSFNKESEIWQSSYYTLPKHNDTYVLLTPKDILTKDSTFINRADMIHCITDINHAVDNEQLRFELNNYLANAMRNKLEALNKKEKEEIVENFIRLHPEIIDNYIKYKEQHADDAISISRFNVMEVSAILNTNTKELASYLSQKTEFYSSSQVGTYEDALKRVLFLKDVIENKGGYRHFYYNGKPINKEVDLQIMFRLVWYATDKDVNREVNNGRGPVDYKISYGKYDATLVEFKLASNSKLKRNLENQVAIYKKANETNKALTVILYFTEKEYEKVVKIMKELEIHDSDDIILIDAINNKTSASNAFCY